MGKDASTSELEAVAWHGMAGRDGTWRGVAWHQALTLSAVVCISHAWLDVLPCPSMPHPCTCAHVLPRMLSYKMQMVNKASGIPRVITIFSGNHHAITACRVVSCGAISCQPCRTVLCCAVQCRRLRRAHAIRVHSSAVVPHVAVPLWHVPISCLA